MPLLGLKSKNGKVTLTPIAFPWGTELREVFHRRQPVGAGGKANDNLPVFELPRDDDVPSGGLSPLSGPPPWGGLWMRLQGAQSEFVRNGNRCPNCNSPVQLVGGVRAPVKQAKPAKPFVPGMGWAVFLVVLCLLGPWTLLITFLLGIPVCIIVARKAPKKSTRLVASVGFPLSFVLSLAVVMLLFGNR